MKSCLPSISAVDFFLSLQVILQKRIEGRREAEYRRLKEEAEHRINQQKAMRKREREIRRKLLHYIKTEEERLTRIQEEEQARKREGTALDN